MSTDDDTPDPTTSMQQFLQDPKQSTTPADIFMPGSTDPVRRDDTTSDDTTTTDNTAATGSTTTTDDTTTSAPPEDDGS
jgi:hypothetical protein